MADRLESNNFIHNMIDKDLEAHKYGDKVHTRFPPEPSPPVNSSSPILLPHPASAAAEPQKVNANNKLKNFFKTIPP